MSVGALNETVSAARDYLDGVLAACGTWEGLKMADRSVRHLFENAKSFANSRRDGVGRETLEDLATSARSVQCLFESHRGFAEAKTKGVGAEKYAPAIVQARNEGLRAAHRDVLLTLGACRRTLVF